MDLEFNKNEDKMRLLISEMTQKFDKVSLVVRQNKKTA